MIVRKTAKLLLLAAAVQSGATASFGQAAESCGTSQTLLFYCTFDGGKKQVGLCLGDNIVSYEFGSDFTAPKLRLSSDVSAIDYTPFSWASRTIFESVALTNVDTRYEIFASTARGPYSGVTEGGIVVTLPNAEPQTLTCDPGSVWPPDPLDGMGQLTGLVPDN